MGEFPAPFHGLGTPERTRFLARFRNTMHRLADVMQILTEVGIGDYQAVDTRLANGRTESIADLPLSSPHRHDYAPPAPGD